jgi:hypothetical protein
MSLLESLENSCINITSYVNLIFPSQLLFEDHLLDRQITHALTKFPMRDSQPCAPFPSFVTGLMVLPPDSAGSTAF